MAGGSSGNNRIGIDVGGTFTDLVAVLGDRVVHHKEPSTPDDPSRAVADGLVAICRSAGIRPADIDGLAHGTTIGLNAIIARRGAAVGLVVTRGMRDLLEIGRSRMPSSFDLYAPKEEPLVPRNRIVEIGARLGPDGSPTQVPEPEEYDRVAAELRSAGAEAAAVVVLNSYADPGFEAGVAQALRDRLPDLPVTASAVLWPEVREYERALVSVLNAYIQPLMRRYFDRLEQRLADLGITAPLFITASNGGSVSLESATLRPIDTVLSGPASGVTAAVRLAAAAEASGNLVTFDMGGTSSDIAVITGGVPAFTAHTTVGGLPLIVPAVEVSAIGAGGGSIIAADGAGDEPDRPTVLSVGPHSAGAVPGPVAYGRGGSEPTVTDAYLVAGVLDPRTFLGGRMRLDAEAAGRALAAVGDRLGRSLPGDTATADATATATATGALRVATAGMAVELQKILARRGLDPREFVLVPYGGAGPTHAALLAAEVGIEHIIVPPAAATLCAFGAAVADLRRDFARSLRCRLDPDGSRRLGDVLSELARQATDWMRDQAPPADDSDSASHGRHARVTVGVDMRFAGQAYELHVELGSQTLTVGSAAVDPGPNLGDLDPAALVAAFHAEHERLYGFIGVSGPGVAVPIELGTARLAISAATGNVVFASDAPAETVRTAPRKRRIALPGDLGGRRIATVLDRDALGVGERVDGPAVVEQDDTTVLIPPGWHAATDPAGNLHLHRQRAEP